MRVARRVRALGVGALAALAGCGIGRSEFVQLNPGSSYPPLDREAPVVLTVGDLDEPYEELGMIYVSGFARSGHGPLNEKLRAKAREAGADAVIFVRYGSDHVLSFFVVVVSIPWDVSSAEGLAVRSRQD
jgi:hypothetical protein